MRNYTKIEQDGKIVLNYEDKHEFLYIEDLFKEYSDVSLIKSIDIPTKFDIDKLFNNIITIDIETSGLNLQKDRILAIGIYFKDKFLFLHKNERYILEKFVDFLNKILNTNNEYVLTGYNLFDFDLPFIIEKCKQYKINIPFVYDLDENGVIRTETVASTNGTVKAEPIQFKKIKCIKNNLKIIDTFHLVCRYDFVNRNLSGYNLKQVAKDFGFSDDNRVIVDRQKMLEIYQNDIESFKEYLRQDCEECHKIFCKLISPYYVISKIVNLELDTVSIKSTAFIWEKILSFYYLKSKTVNVQELKPDKKRKYVGGLVIANPGYFNHCAKIDVASLYPSIMLNYRIHSKKDVEGHALSWLKTLTEKRLELKALAKQGDENAKITQNGLKVLINSLYGFYGTGGYRFNDMDAAEKVTTMARKILTYMIYLIESNGGVIVEADTDGVIFSHSEPEKIHKIIQEKLYIYQFDLEWKDANVYVSNEKNYIVFLPDEKQIIKGGKWRGRDKEKLFTDVIIDLIKTRLENEELFDQKVKQIIKKLMTGDKEMFKYVVKTVRVSRTDKTLHKYGYKEGDRVTYCYRDFKNKILSFNEDEGYDFKYYCECFMECLKEISQNNNFSQQHIIIKPKKINSNNVQNTLFK